MLISQDDEFDENMAEEYIQDDGTGKFIRSSSNRNILKVIPNGGQPYYHNTDNGETSYDYKDVLSNESVVDESVVDKSVVDDPDDVETGENVKEKKNNEKEKNTRKKMNKKRKTKNKPKKALKRATRKGRRKH